MGYLNISGTVFWKNQNTPNTGKNINKPNGNHLLTQSEFSEKLRSLSRNDVQNNYSGSSTLQSTQGYGNQIRAQRQKAQETALSVKKIKYKYKDISSRIISSKTSQAARNAAGQARRELLRLKGEKRKSKEECAELDAAIAHAKAMERVAKKKVKYLEEEERIKVKDEFAERQANYEEKDVSKTDIEYEKSNDMYADEIAKETENGIELELQSELTESEMEAYEELMELTLDMSEEQQELMEELSSDMMEMLVAEPDREMTPEEFKEMKIKHRNKEMKEIVKADADYLKAIFEGYENARANADISAAANVSTPQPTVNIMV